MEAEVLPFLNGIGNSLKIGSIEDGFSRPQVSKMHGDTNKGQKSRDNMESFYSVL